MPRSVRQTGVAARLPAVAPRRSVRVSPIDPARLGPALADALAFLALGSAFWAVARLLGHPAQPVRPERPAPIRPAVIRDRRSVRRAARRARKPDQPPGDEHLLVDRAALADPDAGAKGRWADHPFEMPWRGWKAVVVRTFHEMISDRIGLVAAGCAFWATLALFPAITTLITFYGLLFNPVSVEPQLAVLSRLLPPPAFALIDARVHELVSQSSHALTIGLVISVTITLWSSATGTKSVLSALNMAYEEQERRTFLVFQAESLLITVSGVLGAVLALAIMVGLPALFTFVGLSGHIKGLISVAGWIVLVVFVMLSLALLYRYGPSRRPAKWHWITPGSVIATVLWLAASALFSIYVGRFASYNATYGPLATVAGVMMWFWVSVYVMLLGAELNAELELQTARDTTPGPPKPMGLRGAFVADHVAES